MKKLFETNDPNSTFNKAREEEELFILRGQDNSSPKVVLFWIAENLHCGDTKLREAFEIALRMNNSINRRAAD